MDVVSDLESTDSQFLFDPSIRQCIDLVDFQSSDYDLSEDTFRLFSYLVCLLAVNHRQ